MGAQRRGTPPGEGTRCRPHYHQRVGPDAGRPVGATGEAARSANPTHHEEVSMAKKSRKKKARKKSAANHGKRPNS